MSYTLSVSNTTSYNIIIDNSFEQLGKEITNIYKINISRKKICIVTDSNVAKYYLSEMKSFISSLTKNVFDFVINPGEKNKSLETVQSIYSFLAEANFQRSDIIIALGGGIVGDVAGYTAATFLRGIDFIQVPTSLLAQVDSSIGGKTGVNFKDLKNMVGAFHNPKLVYINTSTLDTLSNRDFSTGMAEIIKHSLIQSKCYFEWIYNNVQNIHDKDNDIITQMIYESCEIKRKIVQADFKEHGKRAILNFGHTIGHALERECDFSLYHGECVSLGMCCALYISNFKGNITNEQFYKSIKLLQSFDLPVKYNIERKNSLIKNIHHDKKNENGILKFIVLDKFGDAKIDKEVTDELISNSFNVLFDQY